MPEIPQPRSNEVFLLGCSRSIRALTPEEVAYINRGRCVLALNKFAAFATVVGIRPTHVWFIDYHWPAELVLQYIFDECDRLGWDDLTFVVAKETGVMLPSLLRRIKARLIRAYQRHVYLNTGGEGRLARFYRTWVIRRLRRLPGYTDWNIFRVPARRRWRFQIIDHTDPVHGTSWARSLDEPMFHNLTSFTAALNYLCVLHPGRTIRLIGTDFNSPGYFFTEEMERRKIDWSDWTTGMQRQEGRHFATIPYWGKTIYDCFPILKERVAEAGVRLTCPHAGSGVVLHGLAEHEPLPVAQPLDPALRTC